MKTEAHVLFANYGVANCGVHQYGRNLLSALQPSRRFAFEHADILTLDDLDAAVARGNYAALIVNYHPQTLPFLSPQMPRRFAMPCIAVMHEMTQTEADRMPRGLFQYYVMGDPTLRQDHAYVFSTGRIIPAYENRKPLPPLPTIGSFGFSVGSKGFQRLVDCVQEEFDDAVIRINIPANGIIDRDSHLARQQVESCRRRIWKPGVRLEATHHFLDDAELLDFLASNTLNAFLYDYLPKAGISSATDHAMAARRPIAITKSIMFRHLCDLDPPITIERTNLNEIMRNGTRPFDLLLRNWTADNIRLRYEAILADVLSRGTLHVVPSRSPLTPVVAGLREPLIRASELAAGTARAVRNRIMSRMARPLLFAAKSFATAALAPSFIARETGRHFNRILDDRARIRYAKTVRRLAELAPDIIAKKIPRANVQQAFVVETVEHFSAEFPKPRILCIGSFEDSAAVALKRLGYEMEEVDPVVNQMDLNVFCGLPSTRRNAYDIIFSTSVIEHVRDDERFMEQIGELLAPGGVGIVTCDFMNGYRIGDPVIGGNYRFYTEEDLARRLPGKLRDCGLVDPPQWGSSALDFSLGGFNYAFATLVFRKRHSADYPVAWARLSQREQAEFFNENGFLVIPAALSAAGVKQAIEEIRQHGLHGTTEDIWRAPFTRALVTNESLLAALAAIFGSDIRFFKGAYVETPPSGEQGAGRGRKALHVDYGIGEPQGDLRNSSASWVNVAFYLTDLTPEHAPLWVVPGSNRNYAVVPASNLERLQERARMVLARAGDAVLFHSSTVHAASANTSDQTRHALFYSYRPAWAKPVGAVTEWPEQFVQGFPEEHRRLLRNLNSGL